MSRATAAVGGEGGPDRRSGSTRLVSRRSSGDLKAVEDAAGAGCRSDTRPPPHLWRLPYAGVPCWPTGATIDAAVQDAVDVAYSERVCAHLSHLEEADRYIALVRDFLHSVEAGKE